MGIPRGTRLGNFPDEVISHRILMRCLELEKHCILPTIAKIGNMGCNRDKVLKLRNLLIADGLVNLPANKLGTIMRKLPPELQKPEPEPHPSPDEPNPAEQQRIQEQIEALRKVKMAKPDS